MLNSTDWHHVLERLQDQPSVDLIDGAETLLLDPALPATGLWQLLCALGPHTRPLSDLSAGVTFVPLTLPGTDPETLFNPSLIGTPDGFLAIARRTNYHYEDGVPVLTGDGSSIQTDNFLITFDHDLRPVRTTLLEDRTDQSLKRSGFYRGFEDLRLFQNGSHLLASATTREHDAETIPRQALLTIRDGALIDLALMSSALIGPQKNWMPVIGDDQPLFVTDMAPFRLVEWRVAQGRKRTIREERSLPIATHFRGSSQVVPFDEGHLAVIHEVTQPGPERRVYRHRFVQFDRDWRLTALSPAFVFRNPGIEYCAGMAIDGDRAIVGFGTDDRRSDFAILPVSEVTRLLRPIEQHRSTTDHRAVALPYKEFTAPPPDEIRIVSITLTGNNGDVIGGALASVVDWVDACLVVDTGVVDDSLERAAEVAGDKLVLRQFPWVHNFAAARNAAFEFAAELDADWAVIIDTDERIETTLSDLRARLASATENAFSIPVQHGTFSKVLFFRLPVRGRYIGPIHEYFAIEEGTIGRLDDTAFSAVWKPGENAVVKYSGYLAGLQAWSEQHPDDPRWHYYIGDTLQILRRYEEAIVSFDRCASLGGWDEEGAWACYRAAECLVILERFQEAIERCARGMAIHPGLAELPWLAAFASWKLGHHAKAIAWARASISMGLFKGDGATVSRAGFRHPPALYEGPYDVLRFALRALQRNEEADRAEALYQQALLTRTGVRSEEHERDNG